MVGADTSTARSYHNYGAIVVASTHVSYICITAAQNWSNGERTSYVNKIVEIVRDTWYPREEVSDDSITQSDSQNVGHGNGGAGNNGHDAASDDTEATS